MCTYFDKVVDGIDVISVGKQQLWDWCSYNGREFTGWLPEHSSVLSYADSLRKGIYLVVELPATFGRVSKPQLIASCTSLKSAVSLALTYDEYRLQRACPSGCEYGCDYEIWHVVDDSDLWDSWELESHANRVDVIHLLDSKHTVYRYPFSDAVSHEFSYLYRVFVPWYGFVLFQHTHVFDIDFFGTSNDDIWDFLILDDYACPATCFEDLAEHHDRHRWLSDYSLTSLDKPFSHVVQEHRLGLEALDALRQVRDAGYLDGGGRVGADS